MAASIATWTTNQETFNSILRHLKDALYSPEATAVLGSTLPTTDSSFAPSFASITNAETLSSHVAYAFVRIFLRCVNRSAWKTEKVFDILLDLVRSGKPPADARVIALKVLFRLRAETNHAIFVVADTECESVAATLCRTAETAPNQNDNESPAPRTSRSEDDKARRQNYPGSQGVGSSRMQSYSARSFANFGRVNRPTPPLWLYPGPKGLPEDPPKTASHIVFSHLNASIEAELSTRKPRANLRLSTWLEVLLEILQQDELEWEVYSYILVHLGAQLTNHALFIDTVPQVRMLRSVVCSQLSNKNFYEPPAYTSLSKGDVAICMYHILTMLVSYREHFSKNEEDDMVKMFVLGIGSWERTADACIHALSVCCHEMPLSITKSVGDILQRMTQIVTRGQVAVHILEFLAGLARLPELYRNFREEEFRNVFGICFRYYQSVRDSKRRTQDISARNSSSHLKLHASIRDSYQSTEHDKRTTSPAEELPQYVYQLTFHVMTFWFMSLKLQDRAKHVPWIIRNLSYTDSSEPAVLEEQSQVLVDLMQRVSYSDRDETAAEARFSSDYDGVLNKKNWIVGLSLLTIETAGRSGVSQITRRRPSATRWSVYRPSIVNPPRHQVAISTGLAAEAYYTSDYVGIMPEDILQEFYAPQNVGSAMAVAEVPILLPDDDVTRRSMNSFDRISPLDGHKVGIIYVGEGQTTEAEILQNVMGSADYTSFINNIGTLTELKDAKFNTQGLDRQSDMDGKFTFSWRDRVTEIVFHVTTMMPTNLETDPGCIAKKRHVGNDHVNIVFNNSGQSFKFDTLPSAFSYIYIVITPEARASFVETRLSATDYVSSATESSTGSGQSKRDAEQPWAHLYYKVTVLVRSGIPQLSPAAETKIVSGASLPAYVRLLALNASVFSQVWSKQETDGSSGEHVSSWRARLREINKLRGRHAPTPAPDTPNLGPQPGRNSSSTGLSSMALALSQAHSHTATRDSARESAVFRRASQVNIFGSGTSYSNAQDYNRHSGLSGQSATEMERSSSAGS